MGDALSKVRRPPPPSGVASTEVAILKGPRLAFSLLMGNAVLSHDEAFVPHRLPPAIDPQLDDTEVVLAELHGTPTDLARLVRRALRRRAPALIVAADAVAAWEARAGDAWATAQSWLAVRGIGVVVVGSRRSVER
jgi:hypothetical protein